MADRIPFRPVPIIPALLLALLFLGWPQSGYPAHDLSQSCYICHNIEGGQVWAGSYSFWSGKAIGSPSYTRPITCDVCHTDYGNRFRATSESHHPVEVITATAMTSDYDNGVRIRCKDCHNANSVTTLVPDLAPDLAPSHYDNTTGNTASDGYPNHDVAASNNQVNPGDPPHLLSMLLSGGKRTVTGSSTYNRVPSANPAADYAYCLSCHDGSANTARQVNVRQDYIDRGHYFKATGGGITAGDRIPCSDCHASHNSPTNARLFEPDNTTFTGTRPTGLAFANPNAPTNAEYRAVCIFCHDDYNAGNTGNGTPRVRGVEPIPRKFGVVGHAPTDTQSCKNCHNPHNTSAAGGPDCLTCHTTGGVAGALYDYIDSLFKGVGPDGAAKPADAPPLLWSQHGGFTGSNANFLYTTPFNTKALNDCFKCHGDRHSNPYRLIDADTGGGDTYAYNPAVGMQDNTAAGITNANAFCLTCHDGNGAAGDVQIGNQVPPNVAANWITSGHGRPTSQTYAVSLNRGAELKCTACHEVHGSNHAKLLPAKKDAAGNFAIPAAMPEKSFRSGASTLLARDVDFTDYSNPASGKGFGTAGDPGNQRAPAGAQTGLCDACHRYAGRSNGGTDNVTNKAHTHEGITTDLNQDTPSQMNFAKDCLECHDTHGTTNLEMVRTTINGFSPVAFTARTGAGSFDPVESGSTANTNSVCVVCHQSPAENPALNVDHNFRTSTVNPDHNEGANCASCHPHGNAANAAKFGFPQAACNSCHGAASSTTGMPASGDGATYHVDANNVIGTRGADNTAHKIHVNYLVNRRGIGAGSTCYVCHRGGGAQESHPGNPTNQSFKSGTQPTAVPYVQVSLDNTGAVLNVQLPGLFASYSGTPGSAAADPNWKTCSNTTCHFALSPSWSGKKQITLPPGVLTVSTPDALPAAGPVNAGSTGNVMDRILLSSDATGLVRINQLKVRRTAAATAQNGTDIAKVALWEDTNADWVPDVQVGPDGVFSAIDNSYTVDTFVEVPPSTSRRILIVADFAPGATNGRTAIFQTVNGEITASYGTINPWTTFTSSTFTVSAPGALTVTTPDALPGNASVQAGSTNNVIDRIALAAAGGYATVSGLQVKQIGTALNGSDIASISFWRDTNKDGIPDSILGGAAVFNGLDNTYSTSGLSLNVSSGTTEWVLVVDNVAGSATAARTIRTEVNNGYVTASAGTVNAITPFQSNTQTISTGGQLTVTTPDALPAAANIRGGSTGNVVDRINLAAATANVVVSGIAVKRLGTALNATDVAQVTFWEDTNKDGTPDVQLGGAAAFNGTDNTYTASGLGLTVTTAASKWVLVVVDLANGATGSRTFQSQMNDGYVTVSSGTVNAITSFNSNTFTISALTGLIVAETAGSTTPVNSSNVNAGGTKQFYATATYSLAPTSADVTTQSAWSRTGTATGSTVGASTGLYTAGSTAGTDTVTAAFKGWSDDTSVTVTTVALINQFENFESASWNGVNWTQVTGDQADWCRDTGTTPTGSTGPDHDKTFEPATTGWFLYTEVSTAGTPPSGCSNAPSNGAEFWLENALNPITSATAGPMQLSFWYHRYGATMGTLQVQISIDGGAWTTMWTTSGQTHGSMGATYTQQVINVASFISGTSFRLRFRSFGATGITGDGAIDDIRLWNDGSPATAPPRLTGDATGIACNTCHQFGPDDATAGYKDSNQYYYALPGDHGLHGVSLIGGTDPVNTNAQDTCTVCHLAATNTFGSDHADGTLNLRSGSIGTRTAGPAYSDTGTYNAGARQCSNTYCHGGQPTPIGATQSWGYGSTTGVCNVCHAAGLTPAVPPTGRHGRHDNTAHNNGASSTAPTRVSNASGYSYSCSFCHYGSSHVSYPVSSVRAAEVTFGGTLGAVNLATGASYAPAGTAAGNEGGKLNWTNGSCTVYCHSNANPVGSVNVSDGPTWTGTAACGLACHGNDGLSGRELIGNPAAAHRGSLPHQRHVSSTAYGFTCNQCHAGTVTGVSNTTINVYDNHVDGVKNVRFSTVRATSIDQSSATYNGGTFVCSNTYCHSDGTRVKTGTIAANTQNWTTAGPLACNACHGNPPAYASAANKANSHGAHVAFSCQTCHSQTTTADNTVTTAANHVNAVYNVSGTGGNVFTYTYIASGSTCAFTAGCHGTATVTWGTPLANGCFDCHTGTEQNWKPQASGDNVANPVVQTEYTQSGHGRTGSNYPVSNNPPGGKWNAANKTGCYTTDPEVGCHSSVAAHIPPTSADPYRLGASYQDNTNGLCLTCHGPSGSAANKNMERHAKAITNPTSTKTWPNNYEWKCVDCHDPHGDGTDASRRIHMVRKAINNPTGTDNANVGSDSKGRPLRNPAWVNITFTDNTGLAPGSYAIPGAGTWGICEGCHRQTYTYNQTTDMASGHATNTCTECHDHTKGFQGAGSCHTCHGPGGSGPTVVWPAGNASGKMTAYGSHLRALKTDTLSGATDWALQCNKCHTMHSGPVQVPLPPTSWADPSGRMTGTNMRTTLGINYASHNGIFLGGTATGGKTTEAEVCWDCHGRAANNVSEWGYNTKMTPTGFPVVTISPTNGDTPQQSHNYGWIFSNTGRTTKITNWVSFDNTGNTGTNPYWASPYDALLRQRIVSVHSVALDNASGQISSVARAVDASGNVKWSTLAVGTDIEHWRNIRCSYCHDVHDTFGPSGKPLLRGAWVGNPYPPDVPPRSGYSYPTTGGPAGIGNRMTSWGAQRMGANDNGAGVPRLYGTNASDVSRSKGGFFIDQNSNDPSGNASMDTLAEIAELCTLCHGTNVNTMDYYTGSKLWRAIQTNGHANATIGGTGTGKANLFDARRGGTTSRTMANQARQPVSGSGCCGGNPPGAAFRPDFPFANTVPFTSFGSNRLLNSGWYGSTAGSTTAQGGDYANWYSATGIGSYTGTAGAKAHNFTCSKCHTPHAGKLPALLETNCMDAAIATWTTNSGQVNPLMAANQSNNCHRKEPGTPENSGWHRLNSGQVSPQ